MAAEAVISTRVDGTADEGTLRNGDRQDGIAKGVTEEGLVLIVEVSGLSDPEGEEVEKQMPFVDLLGVTVDQGMKESSTL